MERNFSTTEKKQVKLVEATIQNIFDNLDWDLFEEIVNKHKRRSRMLQLSEEQEQEVKILRERMRKFFAEKIGEKFEQYIFDKAYSKPTFLIDYSIDALALANSMDGIRGTIRFNPEKVLEHFRKVQKNFGLNPDVVNKNLLKIYLIKVLFHELTHLHGRIFNNLSETRYSSINEVVTEFLSFNLMLQYMSSAGMRLHPNMIAAYFSSKFEIYENEKYIFTKFVDVLSRTEVQDVRVLFNAFYCAYFNGFLVSAEKFIDLLPEVLKSEWVRFLKLDPTDMANTDSKFRSDIKALELFFKSF